MRRLRGIIEDVALARAVKHQDGRFFSLWRGRGADANVSQLWQLREGWTKNLALLVWVAGWLAALRLVEFRVIGASLVVADCWAAWIESTRGFSR